MSNSKHTPGPWVIKDGILKSENGYHLYSLEERPGLGHAAEANARLIAAAPELLESLEGLLNQAKQCFALTTSEESQKVLAMDAARAAIAKATGVS